MDTSERDRQIRNQRLDGYWGIWFELGQYDGQYGDKYSGGLGTYTMKHDPMAVHAPAVSRTFFTYGGTRPDERDLLVMVGAYDHESHEVSRPTVVDTKPEPDPGYDSDSVVDPHDNASISLDGDGYITVFVAGRSRVRPGRVYRSVEPYRVDSFERITQREHFAYPQPRWVDDRYVLLFTRYDEDGNRELFWETTRDGRETTPSKLAGIGGHYQVSDERDGTVFTAFNWHPDGDVDRRTNLYVVMTRDGETWQTVDGTPIDPPLEEPDTEALAVDYHDSDRLVYLNDLAVDEAGRPAVLYVTSGGPEPGPRNDPRRWRLTRWTGSEWRTTTVTTSDHNYDSGSLSVEDGTWSVVGPTEPGPETYRTGGDMALWRNACGIDWTLDSRITSDSEYNHTYARCPQDSSEPFRAFWADGDPDSPSPSRLYVCDFAGRYWQLPESIDGDTAALIGPLG